MSHAITIGGLLGALGGIGGLAVSAFGLLAMFAGGMSDDPEAGDSAGKLGCGLIIGGGIVAIFCFGALL